MGGSVIATLVGGYFGYQHFTTPLVEDDRPYEWTWYNPRGWLGQEVRDRSLDESESVWEWAVSGWDGKEQTFEERTKLLNPTSRNDALVPEEELEKEGTGKEIIKPTPLYKPCCEIFAFWVNHDDRMIFL